MRPKYGTEVPLEQRFVHRVIKLAITAVLSI
jgi:hypothetical protein